MGLETTARVFSTAFNCTNLRGFILYFSLWLTLSRSRIERSMMFEEHVVDDQGRVCMYVVHFLPQDTVLIFPYLSPLHSHFLFTPVPLFSLTGFAIHLCHGRIPHTKGWSLQLCVGMCVCFYIQSNTSHTLAGFTIHLCLGRSTHQKSTYCYEIKCVPCRWQRDGGSMNYTGLLILPQLSLLFLSAGLHSPTGFTTLPGLGKSTPSKGGPYSS